MSLLPNNRHMTAEEYLVFERASDTKHEFFDGELIDLAWINIDHAQLVHNISGLLYTQRRLQGCLTITNNLRIRIGKARAYTYPDVPVICGEPQFADEQKDVLLNPTIIFEILSPSTEVIDRVRKFAYYLELPSLQSYLLVTQDHPQIEHYIRQTDESWVYSKVSTLADQVTLPSANCTLRLEEIYENVRLSHDQPDQNAE
jgi:Uma2 family endonuclease